MGPTIRGGRLGSRSDAVTATMGVEARRFSTVLFAVYLGGLMWVGLVLRRPGLLKVAGLTR